MLAELVLFGLNRLGRVMAVLSLSFTLLLGIAAAYRWLYDPTVSGRYYGYALNRWVSVITA
jgi:hypothetical protein